MDKEIASHIQQATQEYIAKGLSPMRSFELETLHDPTQAASCGEASDIDPQRPLSTTDARVPVAR